MKIRITVHAYAEEKLEDSILKPHNKHYGIPGKGIVAPLRKINNKEIELTDEAASWRVADLWNWLGKIIYGNDLTAPMDELFTYAEVYNMVEKYFVFKDIRYCIEDEEKTVKYYLDYMKVDISQGLDIQLLLCMDAGTIFFDDGIRYYMHSKEAGKHNKPHVHVDVRHEASGSFSIIDGKLLSGEGIKNKDIRRIQKMIEKKREELLSYWEMNTDGLKVDLNQAFELIHY